MTGGRLVHLASSSANSGSIAALFAAPFAESLDFPVEPAIVRPLSWASKPPIQTGRRFAFHLAATAAIVMAYDGSKTFPIRGEIRRKVAGISPVKWTNFNHFADEFPHDYENPGR